MTLDTHLIVDSVMLMIDLTVMYAQPLSNHSPIFLQEICDNPQLFVDDASRFDVQQGELGKILLLFFCHDFKFFSATQRADHLLYSPSLQPYKKRAKVSSCTSTGFKKFYNN